MTKDEYEDFALRYKGCGSCFPMYHTLSRFEKMWFSAIQKDVVKLEKENASLKEKLAEVIETFVSSSSGDDFEMAESAREIMEILNIPCYRHGKVVSKLTKAKEIIKNLLDDLLTIDGEQTRELKAAKEAEQFLNGEVSE